MLAISSGQTIEIPFVYKSTYNYIDPTDDIYVYLKRGYGTPGAIIIGPAKYDISLISGSTPSLIQQIDPLISIERISLGSYLLRMTMPNSLYKGVYTIQISTIADSVSDLKEIFIQCRDEVQAENFDFSPEDKQVVINNKSIYKNIGFSETNSILLIGHTDGMAPLSIHKIASIQDAVNMLRADFNSPLLRGVFDAYSSGAKDIYIMSAGYMSEYVYNVELRNIKKYADDGATPNSLSNAYSFYELYAMKLQICYDILKDYEFIDIIVPLETSIVDTGDVNFVRQLASHCEIVQSTTGEVQLGIIGSRSINTIEQNILELKNKNFDIETIISTDGQIQVDSGKYIILVYGEIVFNHNQIQRSYSSSAAAAFAGVLASNRVDYGLAKTRIPLALSVVGVPLTKSQIEDLNSKNINSVVGGHRSRRGTPYNVCFTGDLTQSISENFTDASNVRIVGMIISEVQKMGTNAIGKFGHDRLIRNVDAILNILKINNIIRDYKLDAFADKLIRGKLYFNITIVSSRTLRAISFNVATGKGI